MPNPPSSVAVFRFLPIIPITVSIIVCAVVNAVFRIPIPTCAAAMAATRLKDWRVADAALARAKALAAPQGEAVQRPVLVMQVESLLERGQTAEAARVLSGGVLDGSRAGLLLAARLATLAGAEATLVARTREDLQTWVALHPGDGSAWLALALVSSSSILRRSCLCT